MAKAKTKRSPKKRVTKKATPKKRATKKATKRKPKRRAAKRPAKDGTRRGRKPLLDEEVIEKLEEAYEAGASAKDAAYFANLHPATLFRWFEKADEDREAGKESMYVDLRDRLERARAKGNVLDLQALQRHGRADALAWKALAHRLAVRDPDAYSEKRRLEVSGSGGGPIHFYIPEPEDGDA